MRPRLAILALSMASFGPALASTEDDVPSFAREVPPVRSADPILKFNGRDLSGFYTFTKPHGYEDPSGVFTVRDGLLRVSGEEFGGIATGGSFGNYHLVVEWKWGEKTWGTRAKATKDSGILLHCVGPDGAAGGQWMESIECQLIEGGCGDFILVGGRGKPRLTSEARIAADRQPYYEKGAPAVARDRGRINWWGRDPSWRDVLGFRGRRDVERPSGEWNKTEVICDGDRITVIVNGLLVNEGTAASPSEGKIQFQSEGAEIFFRKIEVRPLIR
jgi:3-keto-disaccharide hydrolase